jgi:predicted nucleotidyltransferase
MTVAAATYLDPASEAYVADVLGAIDAIVPVREGFLLGSAAVGGFDPERSDIDLVVVVAEALGPAREALVHHLRELPIPVRDLELVLYLEGRQPPDFELNLNEGVERPDEDGFWFVLDAAVAEEHAIPLVHGRRWSEFFEPISRGQLRAALIESIAWSASRPADSEFARVNAIRARHYLEHAEWISKEDAAR